MKIMAELTGFMSLLLWCAMVLGVVLGATESLFLPFSAMLFALWSIGWTVREMMEAKKGQE
jgi:hypothetical protein